MTRHRFNIAVYLIIAVTLIDQLTKWLVINEVLTDEQRYLPVTSFFNIVFVENRGVTFGIMSRAQYAWAPYFLLLVAGLMLFFLGRWLWRTTSTLVSFALGLIMGGALGNIIDRFRLSAVTDFLDFYIRINGQEHHWPAFNIADSAIVTGVALLLLDGLFRGR